MNSSITGLSPQQLRRAADLKEKIASLQNELNRLVGASSGVVASPRKRRKMSAAARARISVAAKARWARFRAAKK